MKRYRSMCQQPSATGSGPHGLCLTEVAILLLIVALLLAVIVPSIQRSRDQSMINQSKFNLLILSVAHFMYSADHNGNQWTIVPHDLATYGDTLESAVKAYSVSIGDPNGSNGKGFAVNPFGYGYLAGYACSDTSCGDYMIWGANVPMPVGLGPVLNAGQSRLFQHKSFHTYVGGKFYDSIFYAPKDAGSIENAGECFDAGGEFCVKSLQFVALGSYMLSPAAMFDPKMWSVREGHFPQSNDAVVANWPTAFQSPTFAQIKYPDLKSHMIEHHWLQNLQEDHCHPEVSLPDFCSPWRFNQSIVSEPVTLFYDGHIRSLPNTEVQAHDQRVKLWRRDTAYGPAGYMMSTPADDIVDVSHHVLTKDGALGRDTLGPLPAR